MSSPPRSVWQRLRRIWVLGGLVATVLFFGWSFIAYRATAEARAAMRSDARVVVTEMNGVFRFSPGTQKAPVPMGLVFFPGALVEPAAYAPLAQALAASGFPVIMVPLPRRGAFGGADAPELMSTTVNAMHDDERAARWIVGGHSRGAVVATKLVSQMASLGAGSIGGLLLIGTTHPRDVDLSALKWPVTKIVGTNDGIASLKDAEANRRLLPPTTRWVQIEGGNHSQFGWYGFQPFDRFAGITREAQQTQLIAAIIESLREAGENRPAGRP
jgi:pimeloyl-ACP methyl ester carboxylesterase